MRLTAKPDKNRFKLYAYSYTPLICALPDTDHNFYAIITTSKVNYTHGISFSEC